MTRRAFGSAALAIAFLAGISMVGSPTAVHAAAAPTPPQTVDTWAFCGVNPDDPVAATAVRAMAQAGGIDATFGPCNVPQPGYTPVDPKNRYVPPDTYMRLVLLNATVGMKTVVYDARLWSTATDRDAALAFWKPVLTNIAAWDLGDEYNPATDQWQVLIERWSIMRAFVEPLTGVQPYVNFLPSAVALNKALTDLPGVERLLSFDQYGGDKGVALAQQFDARATKLMCAVNELDHQALFPTAKSVRSDMDTLKAAGCDQILVFGGFPVYETQKPYFFGTSTVVDPTGAPTDKAPATQEGSGHSTLIPVGPLRLLETRTGPGLGTVDGGFNGIGLLPADTVTELGVVGRAQMPEWARSVLLNVTVTGAVGPGYLTIYPCGTERPASSNLNYTAGTTRAVAVVAQIGGNGAVCVYTQTPTQVIVDLTGFYPFGASFDAIRPSRLLDTRTGPESTTVDGQFLGIGRRPGLSTTEVKVTGRGTVPNDAAAVAVNVTAINPTLEGFVSVYPCGGPIPLASTLNFPAAAIVSNAAIVKVGAGGSICIFSNVETDLVVDVNGYDAVQTVAQFLEPTRVLETRPALTTFDRLFETQVPRPNDSVLELQIGGRVGIPTAIRAVLLNITVTNATGPGFITLYPCGGTRPVASTLNYSKGTTVANLAVATTTKDGKVCVYTQTAADLVVDLSGYHT
ncbi:MAG: hypothetical protein ABI949_17205 [Ilumatobacteraceae bacterium]